MQNQPLARQMSRRAAIMLLFALPAGAQPDTAKNRTAAAGNAFHAMWVRWTQAFNRIKVGTIDAAEVEAYQPMPAQFRKFEHSRTDWIRGLK